MKFPTTHHLINWVSSVSPWLTPVLPSALTIVHVGTVILAGWPDFLRWPVAVVSGLAVECIGFAAIHTTLEQWRNIGRERWPFYVALATGLFYVALVGTVNVILEITQDLWARVVAIALMCLLTVIGALIIAVRAHASKWAESDDAAKQQAAAQAQREAAERFDLAKMEADHTTQIRLAEIEARKAVKLASLQSSPQPPKETPRRPRLSTRKQFVDYMQSMNGNGPKTVDELLARVDAKRSSVYKWWPAYKPGDSHE